MPGEIPGVETRALNSGELIEIVLHQLMWGNFATVLLPEATDKLSESLTTFCTNALEEEAETSPFLIQLHVATNSEELADPDIPNWIAIGYSFVLDEANLCMRFEGMHHSNNIQSPSDLPEYADIPTHAFSWDEINWAAVYGLFFELPPEDLPHVN